MRTESTNSEEEIEEVSSDTFKPSFLIFNKTPIIEVNRGTQQRQEGIANKQSSEGCHAIGSKQKAVIEQELARLPEDRSIASKMKRLARVVVGIKEHGLRTDTWSRKGYARNESDFNPFSVFITASETNVAMIQRTWFIHKNV